VVSNLFAKFTKTGKAVPPASMTLDEIEPNQEMGLLWKMTGYLPREEH
jgi:hypothetical protein